jgi:cobalt-zinc-cadmium efflux system protein
LTGWLWVDPLTSLIVNGVIVAGTISLLRDSMVMSLQGVPPGIDAAAVRTYLNERNGVARIHDLHIWPLSTTETALSAHLVMPDGHPGDSFLLQMCEELQVRFGIAHPTLQIETDRDSACRFDRADGCAAPQHETV